MFNENLKELSKEALKKKEQNMGFLWLITFMISIGSCQKSSFISWGFLMLSLFIMAYSDKIRKELKSRNDTP
jgi:hypothetical protein